MDLILVLIRYMNFFSLDIQSIEFGLIIQLNDIKVENRLYCISYIFKVMHQHVKKELKEKA